ncbi:MAG: putative small secreted protein, partial [Psychroserpens sp.]
MKNILIIVLLLMASLSSAQVTVKGIVKDSIGAPLELA